MSSTRNIIGNSSTGQNSTRQDSRATIVSVFLAGLHLLTFVSVFLLDSTHFDPLVHKTERGKPSPLSQHFKTKVSNAPTLLSSVTASGDASPITVSTGRQWQMTRAATTLRQERVSMITSSLHLHDTADNDYPPVHRRAPRRKARWYMSFSAFNFVYVFW